MNTVVWKFPIVIAEDNLSIEMPAVSVVVAVGWDNITQGPAIWAMVDPTSEKIKRRFSIRGTGHDSTGLNPRNYLGMVQYPTVALVFHLWDGWPEGVEPGTAVE
ncbi:hypothetical protein HOT31_gp020 [Microbacterium phage Hendrix]|uniref:DUF7352 domain-containing protein n=1 Tax=Microbacterium phage Hendrix TaxID=2182341 RepID=A0A2U8UU39_9CAUD|nr:hypothetical protein HOT31_gp020 [Microbacterium phage Hendrix]AWN07691.1 hypothetical protein PBI_HENDRIX_20 [Microbacterium phage Hendrix]